MLRIAPNTNTTPGPTPEDEQERSLTAALRLLVDDVFTYQPIAEKLQTIPGEEALAVLVEDWKQGLIQHLSDSAQSGMHNIIATLDLIQANDSALAVTEPYEWQQIEAWHKPFPVAHVCREDLRGILSDEQIAALSDQDMAQLADKLNDAYQETGGYWESLIEIASRLTTEEQNTPRQTAQSDELVGYPPPDHPHQ